MDKRYLSEGQTAAFARALRAAERSPGTIEKYLRDVCQFAAWTGGGAVSREGAAAWRDSLLEGGYAPVTVNSMVAAVNQFFTFLGWEDCKVKALKIQRKLFRDDRRGADPGGVPAAAGRRPRPGPGATGAAAGDHLCHRHPGERGEVYHGGGGAGRAGGGFPEREAAHHSAPRQAVPEAEKVCQAAKNRLRRDFSHQKRKRAVPAADLGRDERPVQGGRGGPQQGVFPTTCGTCSPAPSIRCAGTWSNWPTCWATAAWRPPASISSPPGRSTREF